MTLVVRGCGVGLAPNAIHVIRGGPAPVLERLVDVLEAVGEVVECSLEWCEFLGASVLVFDGLGESLDLGVEEVPDYPDIFLLAGDVLMQGGALLGDALQQLGAVVLLSGPVGTVSGGPVEGLEGGPGVTEGFLCVSASLGQVVEGVGLDLVGSDHPLVMDVLDSYDAKLVGEVLRLGVLSALKVGLLLEESDVLLEALVELFDLVDLHIGVAGVLDLGSVLLYALESLGQPSVGLVDLGGVDVDAALDVDVRDRGVVADGFVGFRDGLLEALLVQLWSNFGTIVLVLFVELLDLTVPLILQLLTEALEIRVNVDLS